MGVNKCLLGKSLPAISNYAELTIGEKKTAQADRLPFAFAFWLILYLPFARTPSLAQASLPFLILPIATSFIGDQQGLCFFWWFNLQVTLVPVQGCNGFICGP